MVLGGKLDDEVPLKKAIESLKDLLVGFDFASPGDRSRAIAAFLTPALRLGGFLTGHIPLDIAEGNREQCGKGLRQRIVASVYNDAAVPIARRSGGVGSVDETLSQTMFLGKTFIQMDNIRGRTDSQFIEMLMTADSVVSLRIPHIGNVLLDPTPFIFMLTSNGFESTKDLAARASIVRIRGRPPGYMFKEFPEGFILDHVRARQGHYLACVHAIISAWHARGKPFIRDPRHSFTGWSWTLNWICQELFKEAPLLDGHEETQRRTANSALSWLRLVALAIERQHKLGVSLQASEICELCLDEGLEVPGLRTDAGEDDCNKAVGRAFRRLFSEADRLEEEDFIISREEALETREDGLGSWRVRSYVFSKKEPENRLKSEPDAEKQQPVAAIPPRPLQNTGVLCELKGPAAAGCCQPADTYCDLFGTDGNDNKQGAKI